MIETQVHYEARRRLFGFFHAPSRWECWIPVVQALDLSGEDHWMVQSILATQDDTPSPDGSRRDIEVFALRDRLVEIGVRGRVAAEELAEFERIASWEPFDSGDGDHDR